MQYVNCVLKVGKEIHIFLSSALAFVSVFLGKRFLVEQMFYDVTLTPQEKIHGKHEAVGHIERT